MLVRGNFEGLYLWHKRRTLPHDGRSRSRYRTDLFSSLKHEERADPLLRHRLRRNLRQCCEAIVYSAWPSRAR
jgi:hypothetical protein